MAISTILSAGGQHQTPNMSSVVVTPTGAAEPFATTSAPASSTSQNSTAFDSHGRLRQRSTSTLLQWIVVLAVIVVTVVLIGLPARVVVPSSNTSLFYSCDRTTWTCALAPAGSVANYPTMALCDAQCIAPAQQQWTCGTATSTGANGQTLTYPAGGCQQAPGSGTAYFSTQADCEANGSCCLAGTWTCNAATGCTQGAQGTGTFVNNPCATPPDYSGTDSCLATCLRRFYCDTTSPTGCTDVGYTLDTVAPGGQALTVGTCASNGGSCAPQSGGWSCALIPGTNQYGCVASPTSTLSCAEAQADCAGNCDIPCGTVCCPAGMTCCQGNGNPTCVSALCYTTDPNTCAQTYDCGVNNNCTQCLPDGNGGFACSGTTCFQCTTCTASTNNTWSCQEPDGCDCQPVSPRPTDPTCPTFWCLVPNTNPPVCPAPSLTGI